jgi:hypothetical protein
MYNRHIIGTEYLKPPCQLSFGIFIPETDASNEAIGAVLSQEIDGKERPIAFASRTLTKPERRYCVTRKELLACSHDKLFSIQVMLKMFHKENYR